MEASSGDLCYKLIHLDREGNFTKWWLVGSMTQFRMLDNKDNSVSKDDGSIDEDDALDEVIREKVGQHQYRTRHGRHSDGLVS